MPSSLKIADCEYDLDMINSPQKMIKGADRSSPPVIKVHRNAALSENAAQMILLTVVWGTGDASPCPPRPPRVPRPLPQLILSC